jgi:hypothetical protein
LTALAMTRSTAAAPSRTALVSRTRRVRPIGSPAGPPGHDVFADAPDSTARFHVAITVPPRRVTSRTSKQGAASAGQLRPGGPPRGATVHPREERARTRRHRAEIGRGGFAGRGTCAGTEPSRSVGRNC